MKFNFLFILTIPALLLGIVSCDNSGRSSRSRLSSSQNQTNTPTTTFVPNGQSDRQATDSSSDTSTTTDTSTTVSTIEIPAGAGHCDWSLDGVTGYRSVHAHIGEHNICQGADKPEDIYIQIRTPISDSQLCLVPTHNLGTQTIYIGEPRCLMISEGSKIYRVILLKNRQGYSNLSISGTMVMKDKSYFYPPPFYQYVLTPDAYLFCSQFLDRYNDASYCTAFKSVGEYVYKQF